MVIGLYFASIWLTTRGVTVIVNESDESDPTRYSSIADTVAGSILLVVAIVFTILAAQYNVDYTSVSEPFELGKGEPPKMLTKPRTGWNV